MPKCHVVTAGGDTFTINPVDRYEILGDTGFVVLFRQVARPEGATEQTVGIFHKPDSVVLETEPQAE